MQIILVPDQIRWQDANGSEMAVLLGDLKGDGPLVFRGWFPPNVGVPPHTHRRPASGQDRSFPPEPTILAPIALGAGLGAAGAVVGGLIGFAIDDTCESRSWCIDPGGLVGIAVLGTVGASLGAHLGNRRRGSLGFVLLGSGAAWGASLILALPIALVDPVAAIGWLYAVPIVQFGATVAIERITGRRNEARHAGRDAVQLFVAPDMRGGMRLGMSVGF